METKLVTQWAILREIMGKLFFISILAAGLGRDTACRTSSNNSRYCSAVSRPACSVRNRLSFESAVYAAPC